MRTASETAKCAVRCTGN